VFIFHPGTNLGGSALEKRVESLRKGFVQGKFELYVERPNSDNVPTLVTPLGVFKGTERIEEGLSAAKLLFGIKR
jgi:hypothetical protein